MVKNTQKIWWHLHCKDLISVYDHFATLRRKTLSYNFQEFFKGIITIILFFIFYLFIFHHVKETQYKRYCFN